MSSESEDDFQSADEGSDYEDSHPLESTAGHSKDEAKKEQQSKTFDDKVTNLMSALDQLSTRVNKQAKKPCDKPLLTEVKHEENVENAEEKEDQNEEEEREKEKQHELEERSRKEKEIEREQRRALEEEEKKRREREIEQEKRKKEQEEEKRKREIEEEKKKKEQEEEKRKREVEEEKRKREFEEEERQREVEEEKRKREVEEEKSKREIEEEKRKRQIEEEEKRKSKIEEEKKRVREREEEERQRELENEAERKKELEKERLREKEREEQMREQKENENIKQEAGKGKELDKTGKTEEEGIDQEKPSQKAKPIRESKIGMKKPREKLGERLGARKLGAKVEKPLESISSDSYMSAAGKQPDNQLDAEEAQKREEVRLKEEKWKKQQQWEEQQKRWQQIHNVPSQAETVRKEEEDTSWGGGWGGWGTSLLSAASTFTREVGRGVGTVMETVESSLGVPDPETLAKEVAERDKELKIEKNNDESSDSSKDKTNVENAAEEQKEEISSSEAINQKEEMAGYAQGYSLGGLSSLGSLVSGVSGALETASSKVLLGGLDTLEVIGRKAMTVIQDGDPGLRKKRAFLTNNKPNLSMILQDARHRAAQEEADQRDGIHNNSGLSQRPNFNQAWDSTEGPVHLEALSLIAKQCDSKMNSLMQNMPPYLVDRIQNSNHDIKKICEMEEESQVEGDFATEVTKIVSQIKLPLHSQKIKEAWNSVEEKAAIIEEKKQLDWVAVEKELYLALASVIAQLAAITHKGSELALITAGSDPTAIATNFKELGSVVCGGIENVVDQICTTITAKASAADPEVNNTITNMYLQGASGNTLIQEGLTLLSSVLQYANTKLLAADL